MNKDRFSAVCFFAILVFFLFEAARLLEPFFSPLLCALVTAVVCYPLHSRLRKRFTKNSPAFQAFLSDLGVFLFLVVPATVLVIAMISEIQTALPALESHTRGFFQTTQNAISGRYLGYLPGSLAAWVRLHTTDLGSKFYTTGEQWMGSLAQAATGAAKNVLGFAADCVIFLIVLFFLFKDGDDLYEQWNDLLPFSAPLKTRIHERVRGTVEGVVRGAVIIGLIQGFFFLIGYLLIDFRATVLFTCLTALASLIPGIGSTVIWGPLAAYYAISGALWKGAVLLGVGILTAVVDSVVRPLIVGRKAEMPFLWLMFAVLGGIEVFGAKGLILGPLVFSILPVLLEIYRAYLHNRSSLL